MHAYLESFKLTTDKVMENSSMLAHTGLAGRKWNKNVNFYVDRQLQCDSCWSKEPETAGWRESSHKIWIDDFWKLPPSPNNGKSETTTSVWFYSCQFLNMRTAQVIIMEHDLFNLFHAVPFFTDARGGYCYGSLVDGRCASQNSQLMTKMQCCCDSGRCWSDGSTPEMCPIRGTGGVSDDLTSAQSLKKKEIITCIFYLHFVCNCDRCRGVPEAVHPDTRF